MEWRGLTVLLVGRGLVAQGVAERIEASGHRLTAYIDVGKPAFGALNSGAANAELVARLGRQPHDLLLSVGTPYILSAEVLSAPRRAASRLCRPSAITRSWVRIPCRAGDRAERHGP